MKVIRDLGEDPDEIIREATETVKERYARMGESPWFQRAYKNRSLGDCVPIVEI